MNAHPRLLVSLACLASGCLPPISQLWQGPLPTTPSAPTGTTGDTGAFTPVDPVPLEVFASAGWLGEGADNRFGNLVANVGDIDGDGMADLAVSAPKQDRGLTDVHYVFALRNLASGSGLGEPRADAAMIITGPKAGLRQGQYLTAVRGTGGNLRAFAIGASHAPGDGDETDRGAVYLAHAPLPSALTLPTPAAFVPDGPLTLWVGAGTGGYLGHSVVVTPEDGASPASIVVAAPAVTSPNRLAQVFVLPDTLDGQLHGTAEALATFDAETPGDDAGRGLAVADVTGDGVRDLLIGAPAIGPDLVGDAGVAYVVAGPFTDGSLADALMIVDGQEGDELGMGMHAADIDGDGIDDPILSSKPGWFVVHASELGPDLQRNVRPASYLDLTATVPAARRDDSCDEAVAGDLDRDGTLDLAVGDCSKDSLLGGTVNVFYDVARLSGEIALDHADVIIAGTGDATGGSLTLLDRPDGEWLAIGAEQFDFAGTLDLGAAFLIGTDVF